MTPDRGNTKASFAILVHEERCAYCGACVAVCPTNAVSLLDVTLRIDEEACTRCLRCMTICPLGALERVDESQV